MQKEKYQDVQKQNLYDKVNITVGTLNMIISAGILFMIILVVASMKQ